MTSPIGGLLHLLDLDEAPGDVFVGPASNEPHVRAFGGQVAAQALVAAGRTVAGDRFVHSLHSYFLRPGQPSAPIDYRVERVRDGRSFSTRRVQAVQNDQVIFDLSASFHGDETGVAHSDVMPEVIGPEDLAPFEERFAGRDAETDMARWFVRARPFDIRYTGPTPFDPPGPAESPARQQVWIRTEGELADDELLHRCVVAYASDMTLLDAVLLKHGLRWTDRKIMGASLDHAMWFHGRFRADEWLLFDQWSPVAGGGRGVAEARIWTRDGRLVVSVMQEALLRPPGDPSPTVG